MGKRNRRPPSFIDIHFVQESIKNYGVSIEVSGAPAAPIVVAPLKFVYVGHGTQQ